MLGRFKADRFRSNAVIPDTLDHPGSRSIGLYQGPRVPHEGFGEDVPEVPEVDRQGDVHPGGRAITYRCG